MTTLSDADLQHLLGLAAGSHPVPEDGPDLVLGARRDEDVPLARRRGVRVLTAAAALAAVAALGIGVFGGDSTDRVGQLAGAPGPEAAPRAAAGTTTKGVPSGALTYGKTAADGDVQYTAMQRDLSLNPQAAAPRGPARRASLRHRPRPRPAAAPAAGAPAAAVPAADGARVVKKGAIALVVDDGEVTPTLTRVQGFAKAAGGVVASGRTRRRGRRRPGRWSCGCRSTPSRPSSARSAAAARRSAAPPPAGRT